MISKRNLILISATVVGLLSMPAVSNAQIKFGCGVRVGCGVPVGCGIGGFGTFASGCAPFGGLGYTPGLFPNGTQTAFSPTGRASYCGPSYCAPAYCAPSYCQPCYTSPYLYNPGFVGYGYDYGYGYNSSLSPNAFVVPPASQPTYFLSSNDSDSQVAKFTVRCPKNAELFFDSVQLPDTGSTRYFRTPKLYREKNFNYTVKARWRDNTGQLVEMSRKVEFHPGDRIVLDFSNPSTVAQGN